MNTVTQNLAFQNGLAIYIKDSLKFIIIQSNFFSNNSITDQNQPSGSVLLLDNPGNISIIDSFFTNNFVIFGTCIFYSETSKF